MYIEYIVGPVVALLLGMKFTDFKSKKQQETIVQLEAKVELLEKSEAETPKKIMATVAPIAMAIQKVNAQLGL